MSEKENSNPGSGDPGQESIRLVEVLMEQAAEGFTQVVLTNPKTGETRTLDIPKI